MSSNSTLTSELRHFLSQQMMPREESILLLRAGISPDSSKSMTLGAIGDAFDLSRERVRQIERDAFEEIRQTEMFKKFEKVVFKLVDWAKKNKKTASADLLDEWVTKDEEGLNALSFMLSAMNPPLHLISYKFGGQRKHTITTVTASDWRVIEGKSRKVFRQAADSKMKISDVNELLIKEAIHEDPTLLEAVWERFDQEVFVTEKGHETYVVSFGRGIENKIISVLSKADEPMHYSDVQKALAENSGSKVDIRRVHQSLSSNAYLYARGTYGLLKHFPFTRAETRELVALASEVILSAKRQWHIHEIMQRIIDKIPDTTRMILDEYLLNIALKAEPSEGICDCNKMVWSGVGVENSRINIQEVVAEILEQEGREMTNKELQDRISSVRGLGQHFQIHEDDKIKRVESGVWTLRK